MIKTSKRKCILPYRFGLPRQNIFQRHFLPENSFLLYVKIAGCEIFKIRQCPGGKRWVYARRNRECGAWNKMFNIHIMQSQMVLFIKQKCYIWKDVLFLMWNKFCVVFFKMKMSMFILHLRFKTPLKQNNPGKILWTCLSLRLVHWHDNLPPWLYWQYSMQTEPRENIISWSSQSSGQTSVFL